MQLQLQNRSNGPLTLEADASVSSLSDSAPSSPTRAASRQAITLGTADEQAVDLSLPYELRKVGSRRLAVTISGDASFEAVTTIEVPPLHAAHYGQSLPDSNESLGLWWCSSGWKVSAHRPVPAERSAAMIIRAAANEAEAAQLVLRPRQQMRNLSASISDLRGPGGERIEASQVNVLRVRYVNVSEPTDASSTVGLWPDPLTPLVEAIDLPANRNAPLWIRVRVPKNQPPGRYRGTITLSADGGSATAPLEVEVFGFELPDRMTCQTAFGFDTSLVWRYHRLLTEQQRREVLDKYLRCLSDHHISPYEPAPLDPIEVTWKNTPAWAGGDRVVESPHAGKSCLRITDDSTTGNISATHLPRVAIPAKGLKLSFWHRTRQAGHRFLVTLQHYDAAGHWMSGRNNDIPLEGGPQWQPFERILDRFPEGARSLQIHLRATTWREEGLPTGTVWYDDVSLIDQTTGDQLITGGGFESEQQPTPTPEFDFTRWDQAMTLRDRPAEL